MVSLDLTTEEQEILAKALSIYLSDLRMEIGNTEQKDFRDSLKNEEETLHRILESLEVG